MTKQEIIQKLTASYQDFAQYATSLSEGDFLYAAPEKWSAGRQVHHLISSVSPLALAMKLPFFALKFMFGKANRPSKNYEELVQKYQGKLGAGGKAPKQFTPPEITFSQKEKLIRALQKEVEKVCKGLESFSEVDLDAYILPHPLLGKLTVREMMYFTIYHVGHHKKLIENTLKK